MGVTLDVHVRLSGGKGGEEWSKGWGEGGKGRGEGGKVWGEGGKGWGDGRKGWGEGGKGWDEVCLAYITEVLVAGKAWLEGQFRRQGYKNNYIYLNTWIIVMFVNERVKE